MSKELSELQQVLLALTPQILVKLPKAELKETQQMFTRLEQAMSLIWVTFQALDSDKSQSRTFELMRNHASGRVIAGFETLTSQMAILTRVSFLSGQPIVLPSSKADPHLVNLQEMAKDYLAYDSQSIMLEAKKQMIADYIAEQMGHTCCGISI